MLPSLSQSMSVIVEEFKDLKETLNLVAFKLYPTEEGKSVIDNSYVIVHFSFQPLDCDNQYHRCQQRRQGLYEESS